MIQTPFPICSIINVYPTTGIINLTKFTIQSRENEQLKTNKYNFYYYIKGVSISPISIGVQYGNPNVNVIFEYKNIPANVQTVTIELYIDIIPEQLKSYTLFKQLTLFQESSAQANLNYDTILQTLSITNEMNDQMILDAQKSLNRLETDLPKGLNSTYTKPVVIKTANSIQIPKATCNDSELCNGRGYCYNVQLVSFCQCFKGYTGRYCQLTQTNYKSLLNYQKKLNDIINYNLFNGTDFTKQNAITSKEIEAINLGFNSDLKNFQNISDLTTYVNTFDVLLKNSNKGNMKTVLTQNRDNLINVPGNMLGFLQTSIYQTKYDNLKQKIITSGNFTDPNGKYSVKFLPSTNSTGLNNTNSIKINRTISNRKSNRNIFKRNLQTTNTTNTNEFIVIINDPSILSLTDAQKSEFQKSYQQIYTLFNSLAETFISGSLGSPIKINQANEMYNYTLDNLILSDLQNLNFDNYFAERIKNGESYFDAKQCILDNSGKFRVENYNYFYISYAFDTIPFFNFDQNLIDKSISLNTFLKFYNANGFEIKIDCKTNPIKHYLSIYPSNQDFIDKFNLYPEKYQSTDPIYQSKQYMPYFIFKNGTIDHKNSLKDQINMYYRQYNVNISDYTNTQSSYNSDNFKFISDFKYIVAEYPSSGNVASLVYFDGLTGPMGNNYYYNQNQIFQCSENFTENSCFIFIICFFSFSIPILLLLIFLRNTFKNCNSIFEWNEKEEKIIQKDNVIFGANRYSMWDNTGLISSNPINSSKVGDVNMVMESNKNVLDGEVVNAGRKGAEGENNQLYDNENNENRIVMKENRNNQEENVYVIENKRRNDSYAIERANVEGEFAGSNKGVFYSFFYFLIFRNIYSSFYFLTSPFNPKYKTFSKFMFLIYCEMLFTCIFFVFEPFDLLGKVNIFF